VVFVRNTSLCRDERDRLMLPKRLSWWMNEILLPTWRHRLAALKAHETLEWATWLKEVFYVKFPDLHGSTPLFTDHQISYHDCPEDAQKLHDETWGSRDKPLKKGVYLTYPDDLLRPLYPPAFPEITGVVGYFAIRKTDKNGDSYTHWSKIDPAYSEYLPIPEDPIITKNREYFDAVWTEMAERGIDLGERIPVENGYGGKEPWFRAVFGDTTIVMGWRKRVVSLRVEYQVARNNSAIRKLAEEDRVTFGVSEDGTRVYIHAWTKDKVMEYLTVLLLVGGAPSQVLTAAS